jgi:hypothetical protein
VFWTGLQKTVGIGVGREFNQFVHAFQRHNQSASKGAIAHVVPVLDPRAVRAGMLVNVFKNRDDLFYAGLEPGNVDNNSAFVLVY